MWSTGIGGGGTEIHTIDIASFDVGLVETENATILGLTTNYLAAGGFNSAQNALQVVLNDSTVLPLTSLDSIGLSGAPNGGMYAWGLTDARLALGGTLQAVITITSVFGGAFKRGGAAGVIVDSEGSPPTILEIGHVGGGSDTPKTTGITDPYPYLACSLVGISAGVDPILMSTTDGWELLTEAHYTEFSVGSVAIAVYTPVIPLVDASFDLPGGPSGILSFDFVGFGSIVAGRGRTFGQVIG